MLPSTWRYKRFHVSYLFTWLAFGVLVGLLLGQWRVLNMGAILFLPALAALVGAFRSRRWTACAVVVVAGCVLGLFRGVNYEKQLSQLDSFVGQVVAIESVISQDPVLQNGSDTWQVQLNQLRIRGQTYTGEAYATVITETALRRGDKVTLEAKAGVGFGNFRLSFYRATVTNFQRPQNVFLEFRDAFAVAVRRVMPEPEASLGLGFIVGQKSALPADLVEQLKVVGLTHIVVASGYNLTILVRFARRVLARKSRYLALVGSVALVTAFILISGLSPSMNRAAIVTALSLLAWYYGRQFHPVQLILYVASVSAFIYPVYLWSDLGWLLSFAAFVGVLVVSPIVMQVAMPRRKDDTPATVQLVVETLAAEAMTLPIIMVYFGYIPVFALLANILVAPVIPFAMAATFVAGLAGFLSPMFAIFAAFAAPASIVIAYVLAVVERLSSVSWAQVTFTAAPLAAVVWYGLLGAWLFLFWKSHRVDLRASSVVE